MTSNNKPLLIIGSLLLGVVAVGYFLTNSSDKQNNSDVVIADDNTPAVTTETAAEIETQLTTSTIPNSNEPTLEDTQPAAIAPANSQPLAAGTYIQYSETAVTSSQADTQVLFFHATWCPSCRGLDADISSNQSTIPSGVEIYKLDYDTNVALRQKYGVTTQHTLVEIDSNGDLVQKWNLSRTLDDVLAKI